MWLWLIVATRVGLASDAMPPAPAPAARTWPVFPGQSAPDAANYDLEVLYAEGRYEEGLKQAEQRLATPSPTPDLFWMKARFMYEVGEKASQSAGVDKLAYYQEMLDTVEAGLELAPDDPHLLFARGVAMGRLGTTRGVLSSLFMAKDVESSWLTVATHPTFRYASLNGNEILPCDAYHALGIYYRLVPDYWIVQMIAGTRGSLEKSLEWNRKATQCKPGEIGNWKELGATQLCLGQKTRDAAMTDAGLATLRKALTLSAPTERQRIDRRHCEAMIADPSLGCGYSRDGQQDVDEKKLEASAK